MVVLAGPSGHVVWGVGLDRLVADTMSSNPIEGMDVCARLFNVSI
jgi:hypothetical protein